jgi:hypothetical protein
VAGNEWNALVVAVMGKSFQEQLLKLGLVEKKKVQEVRKEQHQKKKQQVAKKVEISDENLLLAKEAEEKKKARVRALNAERDAKLQKRADEARIRQLIDDHKLEKLSEGLPYRFNCRGTVRRIFVTPDMAQRLSDGRLGIVGVGDGYIVIPKAIAEKIREIDPGQFLSLVPAVNRDTTADDPYAEYQVPDDLMW